MATVIVVQRDPSAREQYAGWLREAGYEVATCAGPEAPEFFCPALKHCGCMESESTDAMVYDSCLVSQQDHPASERIIYRLREWYPEKPIVVVSCDGVAPGLARLAGEDRGLHLLDNPNQAALIERVHSALESVQAAAS